MGIPVRELSIRLGSAELTEWMAFFELEPFGCCIEDRRAAIVAATVANVNRSSKSPPVGIEVFMPDWGGGKEEVSQIQSVDDQRDILMGLVKAQKKS